MKTKPAWQPEQMPTLQVGRLSRLLSKLNDQRLREIGITVAQLPVLVALKNGERRTQTELTRIAGIEQPSMAQLLGRMERDGLIHRGPAPHDARSSLIWLTDQAFARLEPGRTALRAIDDQACNALSVAERAMLSGLLEKMMRNLENIDPIGIQQAAGAQQGFVDHP